ncbi:hypothetical protein JW835_13855 [bacterium]|nr:hypothetical protein [bacterium]
MNRYRVFINYILSINLLLSVELLNAQPYKYFFSGHWNNRNISRIDLETGVSEDVLTDCYIGLQLFTTPDQQKMIYTDRSQIYAFDVNDLNNRTEIMSKTRDDEILQILDAPKTNKLILVLGDVDRIPCMTIVFDRNSFAHLDTLYGIYSYCEPFLSEDETKIYRLLPKKEGIFFQVTDLNGGILNESMKCGDLTNFHFITGIRDSKDGKALIVFSYGESYQNRYYLVCDPDQAECFESISFPWRSKAYLSPDAQNVIIEEVQFVIDDNPNTPPEYRPGNVYIFDSKSAILKRRLRLPPEGELLLFDNYPENIYYCCSDMPEKPLSVDISKEQSDVELIALLADDLQDAFEKGWIADQITLDKYLDYLTTAKSHIEQGENQLAENILQSMLNEIEEDTGIKITNEGQLLLSYNSKWLFDKISNSDVSINHLIEYINKQSEQGDIDTSGLANSLIVKLETAQKQLEKEKTDQVLNVLNAFLNELKAQQGKHISDEVYVYLKEKVEMLISQIE